MMIVAFAKQTLQAINWLWFLFTLLVFSLLIKLGVWQSERATEKETRLLKIAELKQSHFYSLDDLSSLPLQELNDLPLLLSGHFDNNHKILLDNQTHNGVVGYRVLQVFIDEQSQQSVLVNLGWIAAGKYRQQLPETKSISGFHQILGHVRIVENTLLLAEEHLIESNNWPLRVQQINVDKISEATGYQLAPYVLYLSEDSALGYVKNWQPIVMPPEKHWAYAFQWFSLAFAWLALMMWAAYRHNKKKNEDVA